MPRNYIMVYFDWIESTQELTAEEKGRLIDAMVLYARGDEVKLVGNERFVFPIMRQQLDRAAEVYDERVKRNQENGRKGGRPKNPENPVGLSETQSNPENPVGLSETQKSEYKYKYKYKDKYNIECVGDSPPAKPPRARFEPPTGDTVREYMQRYAAQKGMTVDAADQAERFVDHFTANGWKVSGKTPMQDWQASARNWLRNRNQFPEAPAQPRAQNSPLPFRFATGDEYR